MEHLVILPVALIAILIGSGYLWNSRLRPQRIRKGIATRTFSTAFKRVVSFTFIEDNTPYGKGKVKFFTRRNVSITLLIAILATYAVKSFLASFALLLIFALIVAGRSRRVFAERDQILNRMFEVAVSEFRYSRGSELSPWNFIRIKNWDNLVIPGETQVVFPAAFRSDDPRKRQEFENHFNGTLGENNLWSYKWDGPKGIVECRPVSHLPQRAEYPGSKAGWNMIPLGEGIDGPLYWDVTTAPHALICGSTGGGKSVTQRSIIFHCIQNPDRWRFLGVDLKKVELKQFLPYSNVVLGIATTLADGVEVMRFAHDTMMERYELMEELGVNNYMNLENPPKALMVMVDEAYMFMASTGGKSEVQKEEDALHAEATTIIGNIARLGRAAGVHLTLATQRPDAKVIYGEIKENLAVRYAAGPLKSIASQMVLDSDSATRLPPDIKGRGILSINGDDQYLQGYFASEDWMDKKLLSEGKNPDGTPIRSEDRTVDTQNNNDMVLPFDLTDGKIDTSLEKIEESLDPNDLENHQEYDTEASYEEKFEEDVAQVFSPSNLEQSNDLDDYAPVISSAPDLRDPLEHKKLVFSENLSEKNIREEDTWDADMDRIFDHMEEPFQEVAQEKEQNNAGKHQMNHLQKGLDTNNSHTMEKPVQTKSVSVQQKSPIAREVPPRPVLPPRPKLPKTP